MTAAQPGGQTDRAPWLLRLLDRPGGLWLFVSGYLGLHALVRLLRGAAYERDEAQQLIFTQVLQLGYGRQPPLYNWLQMGIFEITGAGALGLVMLKYGLLLLFAYCVHAAATALGLGARRASLATLLLFLTPDLVWFAHRDLTHTVLAMALAAATLWFALRVLNRGRIADHLLLGILVGLGLMTKHLYWLWAGGLFIAGMYVAPRRVLRPGMLITVMIALLVASPYLWWMFGHLEASLAGTSKLETAAGGLSAALQGGWSFATAVAVYLPPMLIAGWVFRADPALKPDSGIDPTAWKLLLWSIALALALNLVVTLASAGTSFKSRWLLTSLFALPLVVAGLRMTIDNHRAWRTLQVVMLVLGIGVPAAMAARFWGAPLSGSFNKTHFPGTELVAKLTTWRLPPRLVIAQDKILGGNLAHRLGDALILAPSHDLRAGANAGDELWLVWSGQSSVPARLRRFAEQQLGGVVHVAGQRTWNLPLQLSKKPGLTFGAAWLKLSPDQAAYISTRNPYAATSMPHGRPRAD